MIKRICIFGILLVIAGFPISALSIIGDELITCGLVVIVLGFLLNEQKAED